MRVILYTGKGGVGKTSVAAATAFACAQMGKKTLIVSTDPAHSLADSLEQGLSNQPSQVASSLWAQEIDVQAQLEGHWGSVQSWLSELLAGRGLDSITTEELTVFPGLDELLALLEIKRHIEEKNYDVLIVDAAPTGETLRLVSFPQVAKWWLEKVFPWERRLAQLARPFVRRLADVELPSNDVYEDLKNLMINLQDMNAILSDQKTFSMRIVLNPEKMVIKEAQRSFTYMNLYGFPTDAIFVNRVFPPQEENGYFAAWREVQQRHLSLVRESFEPLPIFTIPYFEQEVVGPEMLKRLGEVAFSEGIDPSGILYRGITQKIESVNGHYNLKLTLPFTSKEAVELKQKGGELIVKVGTYKRNILLPMKLNTFRPSGAKFIDKELVVTFKEAEDER